MDGSSEEECDGGAYPAGAGTLVFHTSAELHANRWGPSGGRCFHIEVSDRRLRAFRRQTSALDRPTRRLGGATGWLARKIYREYRRWDPTSPLAIEGLSLELVAELSRDDRITEDRPLPEWLPLVLELLRTRPTERLPLASIADEAGVHPAHLARSFRRYCGCTVGEFVRRLKVEEARRRIESSGETLAAIALDCGFGDQGHFNRVFLRQVGMSPGAYRSAVRANRGQAGASSVQDARGPIS